VIGRVNTPPEAESLVQPVRRIAAASQPTGAAHADLNQFRGYLRLLAEIELGRRLRAKVDPSDIVQQSLLEAHRDRAALKGQTEPEVVGWLRTILARNLLNTARDFGAQKRDIRRERAMAARLEQSSQCLERFLAASQTSPSQQLVKGEQAERLAAALARLPDDQRTAVIKKHLHGESLADIAAEMDRSTLAVAGLLKRALKKLRTLMDDAENSGA
jgi:RNA polymerase sigma-70 factor (ECF subfamily)